MTTLGRVLLSQKKTELDRETWADTSVVVAARDTIGAGELITELIDFGTVFEEAPFFSFGVEAQEGEVLEPGDFPFVSVGVSEWQVTKTDEGDPNTPTYYLGAYVWINVVSRKPYRLRFRFSFEGIALRNVEYFRGSDG